MNYAIAEKKGLLLGLKQDIKQSAPAKKKRAYLAKPKRVKISSASSDKLKKSAIQIVFESILIAAFCFVVFQSYIFLSDSPHLRISQVNIKGNHYMTEAKILDWAGPLLGQNILKLELPQLVERVYQHPWTLEASAERILPDKLHISIVERKPFAKAILDKPYIMDQYGVLLEETSKDYGPLPIIFGLSNDNPRPGSVLEGTHLAAGLKAMHYINRLDFFKNNPTDSMRFIEEGIALYISKDKMFQVKMNLHNIEKSFENLKIVLELLAEEDSKSSSIDLTFKDKAIVRQLDKPKREIFHSS
jgi:cell division septal protein FtsQ